MLPRTMFWSVVCLTSVTFGDEVSKENVLKDTSDYSIWKTTIGGYPAHLLSFAVEGGPKHWQGVPAIAFMGDGNMLAKVAVIFKLRAPVQMPDPTEFSIKFSFFPSIEDFQRDPLCEHPSLQNHAVVFNFPSDLVSIVEKFDHNTGTAAIGEERHFLIEVNVTSLDIKTVQDQVQLVSLVPIRLPAEFAVFVPHIWSEEGIYGPSDWALDERPKTTFVGKDIIEEPSRKLGNIGELTKGISYYFPGRVTTVEVSRTEPLRSPLLDVEELATEQQVPPVSRAVRSPFVSATKITGAVAMILALGGVGLFFLLRRKRV